MNALLTIPWFRAEPWQIPLPFVLPFFGVDAIPIQPFGLLVAAGVLLGGKMAEYQGRREGIPPHLTADFVVHIVITAFVFAYFLNAAFYEPDTFLQTLRHPSTLFSRYLGLSSYGGFIGAIVGVFLWRVRRQLPVLPVADATAFGFPFGWLCGRLGCFLVHDHPGRPSDFFLAVADYKAGAPPYVARHDLGLYEALWAAATAALFWRLSAVERPRGFYLGLLPVLYAPVRFGLDYLRASVEEGGDIRYGGLTPGHYASIGVLALGIGVLVHSFRQDRSPRADDWGDHSA